MLDELREQADTGVLLDDDEEENATAYFRNRYQGQQYFLGMSPGQRLVIALMFLLMTFILGSFCLLITGRVVPPAFY